MVVGRASRRRPSRRTRPRTGVVPPPTATARCGSRGTAGEAPQGPARHATPARGSAAGGTRPDVGRRGAGGARGRAGDGGRGSAHGGGARRAGETPYRAGCRHERGGPRASRGDRDHAPNGGRSRAVGETVDRPGHGRERGG